MLKNTANFSELTIVFVLCPEEVTGTTNFTIVVEATANKGFAFRVADKTTETTTATLMNVKNPVTSNPTP